MGANHYHADAWGGVQVDEYGGGATPASALCPSTAHLTQSQWDDTEIPDQRFCMSISAKTNAQCRSYKKKGEEHCIFHLKQMDASRMRDSERKQAASDGAEPTADSP